MGAVASQLWFLAFPMQDVAAVRTVALVELPFAPLLARPLFRQTPSLGALAGLTMLVVGLILVIRGG